VAFVILPPVTTPARDRPSLASFWNDLPRDGKFLLSTVAVEALGTGLVLPFGFIYLHEVRGFTIETAGSLLAVPAIVGMAVVGPGGALIDRLGARRIILAGMTAQMLGNVLLAFSSTPLVAALALSLLGAANGIFWPGFNAMIGAVVPSGIRQRYFGVNFTLLNLGIGLGGMAAGSIVDVHRPGTFFAIYLGNALSFLAPLAVLLGPLRKVSGKVDHPVSEQDGAPIKMSYLDILRDRAMLPVIALAFISSFVGYAQTEAGFTAYARLVGEVSTRTIGYAFAANTAAIVLLQLLVLQRIEGRRLPAGGCHRACRRRGDARRPLQRGVHRHVDPGLRGDGLHRHRSRAPDPRPGQRHHRQRHHHYGGGAQPGVIPHDAANSCPGCRTSRSSPVLKASGGQVIGSTAMPLARRAGSGSESPVNTCNHGYAVASAQRVTTWPVCGRARVTRQQPSASATTLVYAVSRASSPSSLGSRKS